MVLNKNFPCWFSGWMGLPAVSDKAMKEIGPMLQETSKPVLM
ncbi:hypothetical protein [Chryseobacterium sp. POE27]